LKYVYLIFGYEEHGPVELFATLDRATLPALLEMHLSANVKSNNRVLDRTPWRYGLAAMLRKSDEELVTPPEYEAGKDIIDGSGWGGSRLAVVPLQEDVPR
jgi:hypothetical protein